MEAWQKQMKQLKLESIKEKSPGFFEASGGYQMKVDPYNDNTLANLFKAVKDYLLFTGTKANSKSLEGGKVKVNCKAGSFLVGCFPDLLFELEKRGLLISKHSDWISPDPLKPLPVKDYRK